MPQAQVQTHHDDLLSPERANEKRFQTPRWEWLLERREQSRREDRPIFYPIYVDPETKVPSTEVGEVLPLGQDAGFRDCW